MKSMTVTKADMALLSQDELTQAAFGALCQSFAMQILDRGGYQDGMYQRIALEFLEEESEQPQQPVQNVFNIDLNLVLETIRKEAQSQKREKKETEKLLEQVLRIQQAAERKQTIRQTSQVERTYLLSPQHTAITRPSITVHNSFHQYGAAAQAEAQRRQVQQAADRAEREVRTQFEQSGSRAQPIPGGPGSLSSRTARFVRQVQEGRGLMQPGVAQPQEKPVIPARKIEENPALQQAVRPAAEMELNTAPAQTPETGKAMAETVAEAMKTAVERQLQQTRSEIEHFQSVSGSAKERSRVDSRRRLDSYDREKPRFHQAEKPSEQPAEKAKVFPLHQTVPVGSRENPMQTTQADSRITDRNLMHTDAREASHMLIPPVRSSEELAFRQETENHTSDAQATAAQPQGTKSAEQPVVRSAKVQSLTEADLQFLSESQQEQVREAIRQGAQPVSQRDIRMTGTLNPVLQNELAEQPVETGAFPAAGSAEELAFRQEAAVQPQPQASASQTQTPVASQTQKSQTQKSQTQKSQTVRPLSPEYTNLLRTFAPGLTEADLQFLSESQRAQVREAIKQGAQPVGQRDIRVTGSSSEHSVQQDLSTAPAMVPNMGGMEELTFHQEPVVPASPAAQGTPKSNESVRQTRMPYSAGRDIRVLTEPGSNQPAAQGAETPFGKADHDLTGADLAFLSQSQQQPLSNHGQPQMEPAVQTLQEAAAEELHHRQEEPKEAATTRVAESGSRIKQQSRREAAPADIRILRKLGTIHPMGQRTAEVRTVAQEFHYLDRVAMDLPTGSDASQQESAQPVQQPDHVRKSSVELTYSPAMVLQQSQPPKEPTAGPPAPKTDTSYVSSLPQWARNFIQNGSPAPTGITPPAPMSGVARDISSLSAAGKDGNGQMMDWSAPNRSQMTGQAAQRPAEVVFKEKNQDEDRQRHSVQMSERELRRTADKIYQIIEDRIRRERRLLGL